MNNIIENKQEPLPGVYSDSFAKIVYHMLEKDRKDRPTAAGLLKHPLLKPQKDKPIDTTISM